MQDTVQTFHKLQNYLSIYTYVKIQSSKIENIKFTSINKYSSLLSYNLLNVF